MREVLRNLKNKYIYCFAILFLIITVLAVFLLHKNLEEVTFKDCDFYQYLSAIRFDYSGKLKLNHDESITELTFKDVKVVLDSTPIYFKNEQRALFPKNMIIAYPISGAIQYKINYFSTIYLDKDTVYILDGKFKKPLYNSFLYDGNDLYFFIEETTINVLGKEYVLSPLSYVIVRYNDAIEIYDKAKENYQVIPIGDEEIIATAKNYSINLSIDAINYNNKERLLIKKANFLKNLQ